jgi:hypothetical protein
MVQKRMWSLCEAQHGDRKNTCFRRAYWTTASETPNLARRFEVLHRRNYWEQFRRRRNLRLAACILQAAKTEGPKKLSSRYHELSGIELLSSTSCALIQASPCDFNHKQP